VGKYEEQDYLEDLGVDERVILNWNFKKQDGGLDWTDLAQDRDKWQVFVNAGIILRLP
jgi:hypothetical protein